MPEWALQEPRVGPVLALIWPCRQGESKAAEELKAKLAASEAQQMALKDRLEALEAERVNEATPSSL